MRTSYSVALLCFFAFLLIQPTALAETDSSIDLENAKKELREFQQSLPFHNRKIDAFFDRLATYLERAEFKHAKEIEELQIYVKKIQAQAENRKDQDGEINYLDAVFATLMDDSQTQSKILENAMAIAESKKIQALRVPALTILAMNGEAAYNYTTRIGTLTSDDQPFQVRILAIYALGEVNPASDFTRNLLSNLIKDNRSTSAEDRAVLKGAISAISKGRERNGNLAPLILEIATSATDSATVDTASRALAELSAIPDEAISQLYRLSSNSENRSSTLGSIAKLARLARECDTLAILRNSAASSKQLGNYVDLKPLFADGIENLDNKCLDSKSPAVKFIIEKWREFVGLSLLNQLIVILLLTIAGRAGYFIFLTIAAPDKLAEKAFQALAPRTITTEGPKEDFIKKFLGEYAPLILRSINVPGLALRWLGSTPYVTKKWIQKNRSSLLVNAFQGRSSVASRSTYLDIGEMDPHLRASKNRKVIWIQGPGGSGKSTFAFRMATMIAEATNEPIIPLVIDDEWEDSLFGFVAANFRADHDHPLVPETILRQLIHSGNLILVFDGISERGSLSGSPSQFARKLSLDLDPKKLIVTSRDGEVPVESYAIPLGPISGNKLKLFAEGLVPREEVPGFIESLGLLRGHGPISPLFVKLAAKQFSDGLSIPGSYPELVAACVEAVNPGSEITTADFLEAARLAAYICIDDYSHVPKSINESDFRLLFKTYNDNGIVDFQGKMTADQALHVLKQTGLMRSDTVLARMRWSYSNDPFCEYLAALFIAETQTWYQETTCQNEALVNAVNETFKAATERNLYSKGESRSKAKKGKSRGPAQPGRFKNRTK